MQKTYRRYTEILECPIGFSKAILCSRSVILSIIKFFPDSQITNYTYSIIRLPIKRHPTDNTCMIQDNSSDHDMDYNNLDTHYSIPSAIF